MALMQEGITVARELGDKRFLADGLNNLGYQAFCKATCRGQRLWPGSWGTRPA
jgi:hypothetical protein